ncbi:MAG: PhoH family protein, partial [Zoogloea sp.]
MATRRPSKSKKNATKLFVLDTNVLMHDPTSLYRFEEHDIYVPMMTLEELDANKKGMSEVARNARQASRSLDEIVNISPDGIDAGIELTGPSSGLATGRLFLQTEFIDIQLPASMPTAKGDNQILAVVMHLFEKFERKRPVILVSKDINMRIKARALGLAAQDYFNDKVLEDTDLLYTGVREIDAAFWEANGKDMESWKQEGRTYYRLSGPGTADLLINEFVYQEGEQNLQAWVHDKAGRSVTLETLTDFGHTKNNVWGITARNREQNFALNLLMNPEIDFVTLLGQAGTGKTLLTLA